MEVNLHTHTFRCGHAKGSDEDYVLGAIHVGLKKMGFSDHNPLPYEGDYVNHTKMLPEELPGYIDSIRLLKEKYAGQIEILVGLECEWIPRFADYLSELRQQLDYLLLGSHGDWSIGEPYMGKVNDPIWLPKYLENTVEGMESGLFLYLAHPDLIFGRYPEFDSDAEYVSRELCRAANRLGMPLEYNLWGVRKGRPEGALGYPCTEFWRIAAEENSVAVIGMDVHDPQAYSQLDMDGARDLLTEMGIRVLEDPTYCDL